MKLVKIFLYYGRQHSIAEFFTILFTQQKGIFMKRSRFFQLPVLLLAAAFIFGLPLRADASQSTSIASSVIDTQETAASSTADTEQSNTTQPSSITTLPAKSDDAVPISLEPGSDVQPVIDAPSSDIETVPADKVPTQQAPSSKGTEDTMAMLLKFVVLWSIIYIIIKVVRMKLDEQKKIK